MKKLKYSVADKIEGIRENRINYSEYETSFRRWLVNEVEFGRMTFQEVMKKFDFDEKNFRRIFRDWQIRYSSKIHVILQAMTPEELAEVKKLQERIKELEEQLERAQIKNVLTETLIDIAEEELKIDIRKKSGPKQ